MTIADIQEYIDIKIKYYSEIDQNLFTPIINVKREFEEVKKLLDELEPKEEWTDIEKSLECLRVEMLNLPTDFDKTVADDHLESLRHIFITQFKENNK